MEIQHKSIALSDVEVKFDPVGGMKFSGYASKFNSIDSYNDTIMPGAYAKTLENRTRPIQMRWNHYGDVIGKWMMIQEDEIGLKVDGELTPNHSKAQDVYALLKHGAINGLSIGYYINDSEVKPDGVRVLKDIELVEISIVETPADLGAYVSDVKSSLNGMTTLKEIENLLREAGKFSKAEATAIVSKVKSVSNQGEPESKKEDDAKLALAIAMKLKTL